MSKFVVQKESFSSEDIEQIVRIHREEIHRGFLTSLGSNVLKILFSFAAESKYSLLLSIKDVERDKQVGFLLGTLNTGNFYKDFYAKKLFVAMIVLLPKIFSFSTVRKILEILLYPSNKDMQKFPVPELLDIAIVNKYQGAGLAKKLFEEFSSQLASLGIQEFKITTGEKLKGAQRFYETIGAEKVATIEVHKGQKTIVYVYSIQKKLYE